MTNPVNHNITNAVFDAKEEKHLKDKALYDELCAYLNHLILYDFERLISLLYRIDIEEAKIKYLLALEPGKDAAATIANLIIERQLQKIKSRKQFKNALKKDDEEKW